MRHRSVFVRTGASTVVALYVFQECSAKNLDTNQEMTPSEAIQAVNAAGTNTVPLFSYSVLSPVDSTTYTGMIVGRSPFFHGARKHQHHDGPRSGYPQSNAAGQYWYRHLRSYCD